MDASIVAGEEGPVTVLMTTEVDGKTYPQCFEAQSVSGGRIVSFLPGHRHENTHNKLLIEDIILLIDDLLGRQS